jgi:hypothetical protein
MKPIPLLYHKKWQDDVNDAGVVPMAQHNCQLQRTNFYYTQNFGLSFHKEGPTSAKGL